MKRRILLLCDLEHNVAGAVVEHIYSFNASSKHEYVTCSGRGDLLAGVVLDRYDGLILHYSLVACMDAYITPGVRRRIRAFSGYKAAFVQDDYRFIDATCAALDYMQIHALFALPGPDIIERVYTPQKLPGVRKVTTLAGYVPDSLIDIETRPYTSRQIDVSYRARKVPPWVGEHSLQKWQIADKFKADAPDYDLRVDISYEERDRLYGDAWIKLLSNSKAVLGTESGASVCDFTGDIQRNVEEHLRRDPNASFDELRELYFKDSDGKILMNVISPRCFEAAALRTLMIMYEGHYSGVMKPWKHFVPLKKDHSNMDEIVAILRDPVRATTITESAYNDLVLSGLYSYRAMTQEVDSVMDELFARGLKPSPVQRMSRSNPRRPIRAIKWGKTFNRFVRSKITRGVFRLKITLFPYVQRHPWLYRSYTLGKRIIASRLTRVRNEMIYSEIGRLRALRIFFCYTRDCDLYLHLSTEEKQLTLIGHPLGKERPGVKVLAPPELRSRILAGEVDTIWWVNQDIMGLGTNEPFVQKYHFKRLSKKMHCDPQAIIDLLFKQQNGWVSGITQTPL